jgi:flagellum-specific ATP synthase
MSALMGQLTSDIDALDLDKPVRLSGCVSRFDGHIIECDGFPATIGTLCQVATQKGETINAEVIGFKDNNNLLSVHDHNAQISVGAKVTVSDDGHSIKVGQNCLAARLTRLAMRLMMGRQCILLIAGPLMVKKPTRWRGVRSISSLMSAFG